MRLAFLLLLFGALQKLREIVKFSRESNDASSRPYVTIRLSEMHKGLAMIHFLT